MVNGVFVGGPNDGETFTHDGMSYIETAQIDGDSLIIHGYASTDEHRDTYVWLGVRYSLR